MSASFASSRVASRARADASRRARRRAELSPADSNRI
jgi:hypothetical protein